jgi:riboflavin synthase
MFTGIVQAVGKIVRLAPLEIDCGGLDLAGVAVGDSICVQGVCLTVTALTRSGFTADVSAETRSVTAGLDRAGGSVNLEKSLALGAPLGGHLVTGHVDGLGEIVAREPVTGGEGDPAWAPSDRFVIRAPTALARFIAEKGSICLDGTSLTVNSVDGDLFSVLLIPHTLAVTTWGERRVGDRLNLEVDLIARYAARLSENRDAVKENS